MFIYIETFSFIENWSLSPGKLQFPLKKSELRQQNANIPEGSDLYFCSISSDKMQKKVFENTSFGEEGTFLKTIFERNVNWGWLSADNLVKSVLQIIKFKEFVCCESVMTL